MKLIAGFALIGLIVTGCQPTDEERYFAALDANHVPVSSMKYAVQLSGTVCQLHIEHTANDIIVASELRSDYTASTILALTPVQMDGLVRASETVYCP
jgi:hypothetical protein